MEASSAQGQRSTEPTQPPLGATQPTHPAKVRVTENERVVFVEEGEPNQYLKVVASGELDEIMLDALSDYINRQKRRLNRAN